MENPVGSTSKSSRAFQIACTVGEAESRGSLPVHHAGPIELLKGVFGKNAVMRDALRLKEATVGLKADLPKCGQVAQTLSDVEVACVVDSRLRAEGLTFLVVLLDSRALIVDVQRGNHAIGGDSSAKTAGVDSVTPRSKISWTCLGRPISKFSRISASSEGWRVQWEAVPPGQ